MAADGTATTRLSPRALIVTFYGLYVRELGGWIGVGRLIGLMDRADVDAQAVRSAVSRLKKRDVVVAERRDGVAGYALSEHGAEILAEGDRRIFPQPAPHGSDWVLAVYSVPESERERRHALRARLSGLGFATISSGTWIAPAHVAERAASSIAQGGLERYVELFHADHLGFDDVRSRVAVWWDLDAIEQGYRSFVDDYGPLVARWDSPGDRPDTGAAFADHLRMLTTWRRLVYHDPGLPLELLPPDWVGTTAGHLFERLQALLGRRARRYVASTA